jgi:hypothetical protein
MSARHRDDESSGMTGTSPHPAGMTARLAKRTAAAPNEPLGCAGCPDPWVAGWNRSTVTEVAAR